ncbi:MAG: lysophospholipid acyltransferase family protein, partial [Armatimonadota bacterium]|nr:lysophospholipid acyltransferase family protein [Armatimonadota bacterium]
MRVKQNPWTYWPVWNVVRLLFRALGGAEVCGREHFPARGPVMVVSNHLSHVDPPLLAVVSPRYTFFMAKEELFRVPVLGAFLRSIGTFPVKRGTVDREAIRHALAVLAAGEVLGMF